MISTSIFESTLKFLKLPRGWDIRYSPQFFSYSPSFELSIETNQYILETARSMDDLLEVFELRYKIFLEESGAIDLDDNRNGFDVDELDSICDHIIIKEKDGGKIVGTYRVISSQFSKKFYSQTEFYLDEFLLQPGAKLELGRACIHHAHRNGAVIDLLWRGIAQYIELTNTKYLFGCSSVKLTDPAKSKGLYEYLVKHDRISEQFEIQPIDKFKMDFESIQVEKMDEDECKALIPALLRSYFTAGSKIYGTPALDLDFKCIDFLTILNLEEISRGFKRRYFKK